MRVPVLALALVACNPTVLVPAYRCDVTIAELSSTSGSPGEPIAATGTPFTTSWDTAVYVGGTRAVVDDVTRYNCDPCDTCFDDNSDLCLTTCADCDACDVICNACQEVTTFVVPDVAAGETTVRLLNSHGESNSIPFVVVAKAVDTGDSGAETGDSASSETGDSGK
jgi:hypothetical protein